MLCQFTFKNFKSYRDETVFDLQATSIGEHSDSLLVSEKDGKAFLPVSVVYGPNAGGKSGLLEALNSLVSNVMYPIDYIKKTSNPLVSMRHITHPPFLFNESSLIAPTEFMIFFRHGEFEFRYSLALSEGVVVSESLFKKSIGGKNPAKIFERDSASIQLGASMKKKTINTIVNPQMPYISFLAINYDIEIINLAIEWFSKCIFINYTNPTMYSSLLLVPSIKKTLVEMLQEIDIPISSYRIDFKKDEKNDNEVIDKVYIVREIGGKKYELDIIEESRGTFKLFGLLSFAIISLAHGRLLVVDELDASLHPKLLRYIIRLFTDKKINGNNAQLLFTSHDITTMKNDLFRRDEIWFAAKDSDGASEIYSLYEIRNTDGSPIKPTAAFDKQYLEGRYGADPYLSEMLSLKWED